MHAVDVEGRTSIGTSNGAGQHRPSLTSFSVRLTPPIGGADRVPRERLTTRLVESRERLVLVVAPAGYGKTTLAAQWSDLDDRRFAWVALGAGMGDPAPLWSSIAESVGRAEPTLAPTAERLESWLAAAEPSTMAVQVAEALEASGRELVIVLDDYHFVKESASHASIASFLELMPPLVQLVVVSRQDPPLTVGRLRANGDLLELRADELALPLDEIDALMNATLRLDLTPEALALLHSRTEGWPALVALAGRSLRDRNDREGFLERFGGSNRFVVDYLTEVVFDELDSDRRSFLLGTSILERMSGDLCDAVLDREGSTQLLSELEKEDLFLSPLDDRREWYRYHSIFREFLYGELMLRSPERVPELRRRAFDWLAGERLVDDACHQALAAREYGQAAGLVSANWLSLAGPEAPGTILTWIDEFPKDALRADAPLCVARAWLLGLAGDHPGSLHASRDALAAEWSGPLPDGAASVEAAASLLRASFVGSDVAEQLRAARRGLELEADGTAVWQTVARVLLGWACYLADDPLEARTLVEQAAEDAPELEIWMTASDARSVLAAIALAEGKPDLAEQHALAAVEIAETRRLSGLSHLALSEVVLGRVLADRGELGEAERVLTQALERVRARQDTLPVAECLLALAPVRRALKRPDEARELLAEAACIIEGSVDPGILRRRLEETTVILGRPIRRTSEADELTDREQDVLRLLNEGRTKREIGAALFLSYNTIHSHTKSIYRKLGASSRQAALGRARELALI
jgi:LuxR family maltose regulon positive regulatory protein